jgi:ArsR family transcriptional regulator
MQDKTQNQTQDFAACDCSIIHEDVVRAVAGAMPDDEVLFDVAELFKVFGDSTRVKILCALQRSEMCVCDIAAVLGMSTSATSHQLRVLKQSKLVKYRREGKIVFYSLDDEHVSSIFVQAFEHVEEGAR